ncbi:TPA: hypothetical protein H1008_03120 [archaeon]|nr:hypothetical protein [Candidatus Undinarchaeales archaeon SRR5007147.bin71]
MDIPLLKQDKGQGNLGVIIAVVLLIIMVMSATMSILDMAPSVKEASDRFVLQSRTLDISNLLLNDPGLPADWDSDNLPDRIGLAEYNNFSNSTLRNKLDWKKVLYINDTIANNYTKVSQNLSLENSTRFWLKIESSGRVYLNMTEGYPSRLSDVVVLTRIMVINQTIVNVTLMVW